MTFSGMDASRSQPPFWRDYGACSPDGRTWTLMNGGKPIVPTGPGAWDSAEQGRSCHFHEDGVTWLFYNGSSDQASGYVPGTLKIGLASTTDGAAWTKHGVVLEGTAPRHTRYSCWVTKQGKTYVMLYNDNQFEFNISRATAPAPTGPWTPDPANPIITGEGTPWPNKVEDCSVVRANGEYLVFVDDLAYSQGTPYGIPVYRARDILAGPFELSEVFIPQPDSRGRWKWDSGSIGTPGACLTPDGGILLLYSAPQDGDGAQIGAAFIDL